MKPHDNQYLILGLCSDIKLNLQLIAEDRFRALDKIKTIGSTYMAAVGLIPDYKIASDKEDGGISAITYMSQVRKTESIHPFNKVPKYQKMASVTFKY